MSAPTLPDGLPAHLIFGQVHASDGRRDNAAISVEWVLKRNCSLSPSQLLAVYASLCVISLGIATYFWVQGATLVMPFAWAEVLVFGVTLLLYARHAADRERIALQSGRLTVEHQNGGRVERAEFVSDWVRVEPQGNDRSLIELSGQGRVIAVGRYVRPELRRALAEEFRTALRQWPSGGESRD
ncbi:DUF2244 domain-containing protein [Methylibium sp.]|uniref:DUF2244 domain-containing protein n=1 Tax=Methylibium sp. TaxID=2067992 RepID=UPI0017B391B6|nr:DUF2244 domain-containing protein [Methylibium sp.]MBA3589366.1 DUF2244 domain-containing protein [Methylibium sp.]